jgi:hypothetical protein
VRLLENAEWGSFLACGTVIKQTRAGQQCYRKSVLSSSTSAKPSPTMAFSRSAFAVTDRRFAKTANAATASGIAKTIRQRTTGIIPAILSALVSRSNMVAGEKHQAVRALGDAIGKIVKAAPTS